MEQGWSDEFNCPFNVVSMALKPTPLGVVEIPEDPNPKKRKTEGEIDIYFKLFKFPADFREQYMLELYKVGTNEVDRYTVRVDEREGTCTLKVHDYIDMNVELTHVEYDPYPLVFHKTYEELTLEDRLYAWTIERRRRNTGKDDKFYYHQERQFRSLVETAAYVVYAAKPKELRRVILTPQPADEATDPAMPRTRDFFTDSASPSFN